ncbi:MAG: hypothetical protein AAGH88_00545 [Planctomycetota bacterium]
MEILDAVNGPAVELSPMFHYYFARGSSGWPWLTYEQGFAAASTTGICTEADFPSVYDRSAFGPGPKDPNNFSQIAERFKIQPFNPTTGEEGWLPLTQANRLQEWKTTIDQSLPVLLGIYLSEDYHRLENDHPNRLPDSKLPPSGSPLTQARHAAVVSGYNDNIQGDGVFYVSDSRGVGFGDQGTWLLPYQLVQSNLVIEAWTVRNITYDM